VCPRAGLDVLEDTKICRPCLEQKADIDAEKLLEVVMEGFIFRDDINGAQLCWCRF
jgi:ferredoxin-thioredoxin reductase catalytic subunit